jgi:hypothetical protein
VSEEHHFSITAPQTADNVANRIKLDLKAKALQSASEPFS